MPETGCRSSRLLRGAALLALFAVLAGSVASAAKDQPLTAIFLYDGPSGPAYVQIAEFQVNTKTEVYVCAGTPLDQSAYKKLGKVVLAAGVTLDRAPDGELKMTTSAGSNCVLPANLKMEKKSQYPLKDLVDQAVVRGRVVGKSANGSDTIPDLKPGSTIVLLAAPDTELAEYLRAAKWNTEDLYRGYLGSYPTGAHFSQARRGLADLLVAAGEREQKAYADSVTAGQRAPERLRNVKTRAEEAARLVVSLPGAQKLSAFVAAELQRMTSTGQAELGAFRGAVAGHTTGYEHLGKARAQADTALAVDPLFAPASKLKDDVEAEAQKLDFALKQAGGLIAEQRFDDAYTTIAGYRSLAPEVPAIQAAIDAAFSHRRDAGQDAFQKEKWENAIDEFRRALAFKDDAIVVAALKKAEDNLRLERDHHAADQAVQQSQAFAEQKQYVEAYEVLDQLPEGPRAFVGEQLTALQTNYIDDAVNRADGLMRLHVPIRGRADEDAVRKSFQYLQRASQLSDAEPVKIKLDLVSDRISEYYLKEARRLFEKPHGSGTGLGWNFLVQAQSFKPDQPDIRNELVKNGPVYETRSKLSLGLQFRDQTSRRESLGFADQLRDAVASGLEASSVPGLKVQTRDDRSAPVATADADAAQRPNFVLACDIVEHRVVKKESRERIASKYRAGQRDVRNPAWLEAKRRLDAAQEEFNAANAATATAMASKQKRLSPQVAQQLQDLSTRIAQYRKDLEAIPEFQTETIILPYSYTKRLLEMTGTVEFSFRLVDTTGTAFEPSSVKSEVPKSFAVLENVKPEDVGGVPEESAPPDEADLLADVERQAQTALIRKIVEKLAVLPGRVLQDARAKAGAADPEAAAESYIVYLNVTPPSETAERTEAQQFLAKEFNIIPVTPRPKAQTARQ